jgi:DNA-binding beta-propeller fold protein YncE
MPLRASWPLRRTTLVAAAIAIAAAVAAAPTADAAVGDITPLGGLGACNAATGFLTGACTPGSPIGNNPVSPSVGGPVLSSPDGKHVYVIGRLETGESIGVFTRGPDGVLTPSSCLFPLHPSNAPAPGTPPCVSSGDLDIDVAITFQGNGHAALAPDGRQLYVTSGSRLVVLDRDPATGALRGHEALPVNSTDVAVSRDGFNVYAIGPANGGQLDVYTRALNGSLLKTQCLNTHGDAGCQRVGGMTGDGINGTIPFTRVAVSPDGGHVYAANRRTLVPLSRNADGTLAPLLDPRVGKQAGCVSGFTSGVGCLVQRVPGLEIDDLAVSPDGVHVYAGTTALRRDAATGRLSSPTAVPFQRTGSGLDLTVSPDGRTVYYVDEHKLVGIARDPNGSMTMTPLPAPGGCFNDDGADGCQTANPTRLLADVALDAAGQSLYLSSGDIDGAILRSFHREAAPPLPVPKVGRARLVPRQARARVGHAARVTLVWTHPRSWRALRWVQLSLRSPRGAQLARVRAHVHSRRIDAHGIARGGALRRSGRTIGLSVAIVPGRGLAGTRLRVDALAADTHAQSITGVGTVTVPR